MTDLVKNWFGGQNSPHWSEDHHNDQSSNRLLYSDILQSHFGDDRASLSPLSFDYTFVNLFWQAASPFSFKQKKAICFERIETISPKSTTSGKRVQKTLFYSQAHANIVAGRIGIWANLMSLLNQRLSFGPIHRAKIHFQIHFNGKTNAFVIGPNADACFNRWFRRKGQNYPERRQISLRQ